MDVTFAEAMHAEWVSQARRALTDDPAAGFVPQGYEVEHGEWMPFQANYLDNHGFKVEREGYWHPERTRLLRLLAMTYQIRSERLDPFSGEILPHRPGWEDRMRARWPKYFERSYPGVGPGWADLLAAMCVECDVQGYDMRIEDVKEKFGGCRLNLSFDSMAMHVDIDEYVERLSIHICEECGAPGKSREVGGWIKTECELHRRTK